MLFKQREQNMFCDVMFICFQPGFPILANLFIWSKPITLSCSQSWNR